VRRNTARAFSRPTYILLVPRCHSKMHARSVCQVTHPWVAFVAPHPSQPCFLTHPNRSMLCLIPLPQRTAPERSPLRSEGTGPVGNPRIQE
jgi:hypothetical protein